MANLLSAVQTLIRAGFLNDPNLILEVEGKMSESSTDTNDPILKILY